VPNSVYFMAPASRAARSWYPPEMPASSQSPGPLKVLIVEDHPDARTTLRMLLSMAYGHSVYEAADGHAALQVVLQERPDVALIDLGLPGMDGYEVARRIRSTLGRDEIFLIALTGHGEHEDRLRTEAAGFDVHLVKPVETAALAALLSQVGAGAATRE
jgi:CheY-like chemotaxis protein